MLAVVLLTSTLIALAGARIYDRCELARDLLRLGVPRDQVSTWVCIALHESSFNTAAWNTHSGDHGLLQISELYWCGPGKACGVTCSSLRDTDITDDVQCALRIYREHTRLQGDGFMAWVVYPTFCRGNGNFVKDCNRLSKSYSEKLHNISQRLPEPGVLYSTATHFVDTDNINQPLPGYLAINSLIQKIDFEKFERDYYNINKQKFDWQSYKIDNIDELKLPVANRRGRVELATPPTATSTTHATITTPRTTTTPEPALIGIKPPSPRLIESNQFRRRNMKLDQVAFKTDNYSVISSSIIPRISYPTTTPRIVKVPLQIINGYGSPLYKTSTGTKTWTITTITPQTTLKELSSKTLMDDSLPLTALDKPTTSTTLRTTEEVNIVNSNYKGPQKLTTKKPATTGIVTARKRNEAFRDFTFYSSPLGSTVTLRPLTTPYVPEGNKSTVIEVTTKKPRYTLSQSTCNRLLNTTFHTSNTNLGISLSNTNTNKTSAVYFNEVTSTTPSITNISEKSKEYLSFVHSTNSSSVSEMVHSFLNKTLTSRNVSQTSTVQPFTLKPQPSAWGKSHYITTQRSTFSSLSSPTAAPQTTKLDSETSNPSTTHSIFDLYLNPTRRPTLQRFSFAPINKNPFRVRIFSGGTTPSPSGENGGQ